MLILSENSRISHVRISIDNCENYECGRSPAERLR